MFRLLEHRSDGLSFQLDPHDAGGNRFTTLIGANGTGKSRLLSELAQARKGENPLMESDAGGPATLAVSNLVLDAFPKPRLLSWNYRYLGLRQANNTVSTGSLEASFGPYLLELRSSWLAATDLSPVLRQVGVEGCSLIVSRSKRNGSLRDGDRLKPFLKSVGLNWLEQPERALRGELEDVVREFMAERELGDALHAGQRLRSLAGFFDVPPYLLIAALRRVFGLDLSLRFRGANGETVRSLSAGQSMLLSMLLRICAAIRPGSLVLIDEPETGAHPEWQSGFIPLIREIVPEEAVSHFFVATHSPYLVADSTDVLIARSHGDFEEFTAELKGMSIEHVLYRVFGARVVGNFEVESDLSTVITWIASSDSKGPPLDVTSAARRLERVTDESTPTVRNLLDEFARNAGRSS